MRLLKYRFTRLQAGVSCLPVAWLLLVLSAAAVADEELSYNFAPVDPPRSVPDFSLPDMDAELHALQDYRGKVVLINFWAT